MLRRLAGALALAIGISVIAPPAGGDAAPRLKVRVAQPRLHDGEGGQRFITVRAKTRARASCSATVRVGSTRQSLMRLKADRRGWAGWRWMLLAESPSGTWKVSVACRAAGRSGTGATRVLIVNPGGRRDGALGEPNSVQAEDGEFIAGRGGGTCGHFEPGQCTCLAYQKRQDVYDTAVYQKRVVPAGGARLGSDFSVWDGGQWLVNAQRAGFPTGSQPVAGALVVWGVPNAASYGHVAYVERVESPTRVLISECNYDWKGSCRTIWMNPTAKANLQGYVYGGPAGNGPSGGSSGPAPGAGTTGPAGTSSGSRDLYFVKTKNTGSGRVEVHSATVGSGYGDGQHSVTWFSPADADNGWFQLVGSDLFFIKTRNTGSGRVEVHSATAASGYQSGQHSVTWFSPADAGNGWFQLVGSDLFFIKTRNTGSGRVEVHSATAGSGYQSGQHSVTWFSPADANNGFFQMVGGDLFFAKTHNPGSGRVELHSATARAGYQDGQHSATWLSPADADNGWFQVSGTDLFFIKSKHPGAGRVEVHSATAGSGYQSGEHAVSWFSPADADNGWFQVAGTKG